MTSISMADLNAMLRDFKGVGPNDGYYYKIPMSESNIDKRF